MATDKKILLLAGKGLSTNIIFHDLQQQFGLSAVVLENKEPTAKFLKRRVKKLGLIEVAGQLLFQVIAVPMLKFFSANYSNTLISNIPAGDIAHEKLHEVNSINDASVAELLKNIAPDLVVVNGTRIISKKILAATNCPVINMHAGITPMYRGVHGGYWALAENDKENCGLTVHMVDAGVDTGNVLYQQKIDVVPSDNFTTYPLKQLIAGLPLLRQAVQDALWGNLQPYEPNGRSRQWYHPTIWKYLYLRMVKGVK